MCIVSNEQSSHLSTTELWECTADGSGVSNNCLTPNTFLFLLFLVAVLPWGGCVNFAATQARQSHFSQYCGMFPGGERFIKVPTCQQTHQREQRADFLLWHKKTKYTGKVLNSPSLIQKTWCYMRVKEWDGGGDIKEETFKKVESSVLRKALAAGGGSEKVRRWKLL